MEVREAAGPEERDAALALRERVFCGEQGVSIAAERDGADDEALHVVALAEDGAVIGTCRLVLDGDAARLGRMCVDPALRGSGVGQAVLVEAERRAAAAGARLVRLHAQTSVRRLYERAGYTPSGDEFIEEGIPHVAMEKPVA